MIHGLLNKEYGMKRAAWALAGLMAFASLVFWGSATGASSHPTDHRRYERTKRFTPPWEAFCSPHECGVPTVIEMPVGTPSGAANVDVVLTLTLDYRTSASDWGALLASFREGSAGPTIVMNPRAYAIMSPSSDRFATTTLVWVKKGIRAAGRNYTFRVGVNPRRGDDDPNVLVEGRKLSLVIDMTEAGP